MANEEAVLDDIEDKRSNATVVQSGLVNLVTADSYFSLITALQSYKFPNLICLDILSLLCSTWRIEAPGCQFWVRMNGRLIFIKGVALISPTVLLSTILQSGLNCVLSLTLTRSQAFLRAPAHERSTLVKSRSIELDAYRDHRRWLASICTINASILPE